MTQLSGFKSQASIVSSNFYSLRFGHLGRRFSFRTVDLSRESRVLPPIQQFLRTRIKIIFRGSCQPRKLKSAKNKLHVFETKPRKFGDAKISHYTVAKVVSVIQGEITCLVLKTRDCIYWFHKQETKLFCLIYDNLLANLNSSTLWQPWYLQF